MIKKRNLDNSLIQWLMTVTNLGPGIGEIKYVAPAASSTSQFRTRLQQDGVDESDLFTTLLAAETALTAYRNDIVLAFPGKYTQILEHAWDKAHTHLIGLGGPVQGHYRTSTLSDMRNVLFHTITATNPSVINVTGENCQFHNFQAHNEGDNSANVAAVIADKFGCYFKGVNFRGATSTTGKDNVNCGSLQIDGAAHYNTFVDCWIGHNTYSAGVRAVEYAGHLVISEGYSQNLHFQHCRFLLRSETANCGLVRFAQSVSADRQWLFEDCSFDNFYADWGGVLNAVFVYQPAVSPQTSNFHLRRCSAFGFNEWTVKNQGSGSYYQIQGDMPDPYTGGGLMENLSTDNAGG